MLPAKPYHQLGVGLAPFVRGHSHQPSYPGAIESLKWVAGEDTPLQVVAKEQPFCIVATQPVCHLGEVVGAKREEVGDGGDQSRGERRPGSSIMVPTGT